MTKVDFWEDNFKVESGEFKDAQAALEAAMVWSHLPGRSSVCFDRHYRACLTVWHDGTCHQLSRLRDTVPVEGRLTCDA